ncbi:hypothetical protein O181_021448 [Austropuccinia psidii MF-1]|uniref:Uncharacterized protein n=1 Tax=Austropuccinia psidii MF-1 TaxID=1389203 RepID=A0A9Q3GVF8_9BASI|nr:hypothetical protein [Austropuccinia psidii MF-1]
MLAGRTNPDRRAGEGEGALRERLLRLRERQVSPARLRREPQARARVARPEWVGRGSVAEEVAKSQDRLCQLNVAPGRKTRLLQS